MQPNKFFNMRKSITEYLTNCSNVKSDEIVEAMNTKKFGHHTAKDVKWILNNCRKNHWLKIEGGGNSFVYKNMPVLWRG